MKKKTAEDKEKEELQENAEEVKTEVEENKTEADGVEEEDEEEEETAVPLQICLHPYELDQSTSGFVLGVLPPETVQMFSFMLSLLVLAVAVHILPVWSKVSWEEATTGQRFEMFADFFIAIGALFMSLRSFTRYVMTVILTFYFKDIKKTFHDWVRGICR